MYGVSGLRGVGARRGVGVQGFTVSGFRSLGA